MLSKTYHTFSLLLLLLVFTGVKAQEKVALVLSGGGANGLAHIGVLKVLEANNIPIDYIAGTSMGAIVGGLYASGFSPQQIEAIVTDPQFIEDVMGSSTRDYGFYFKKPPADAGMVEIKYSPNKPISSSLPTNVVDPFALDFKLVQVFAPAGAVSKENFDSLFVPFRCVASDVEDKISVLFKSGNLGQAIRASSTFPFYYKPVLTNGKVLFDGGLYNNFPVNVAVEEFQPDFIIGSNVSFNYEAPSTDDILSQLKNMLVSQTDYSLQGKKGIIISPQSTLSAFDYEQPQYVIQEGEKAANALLDSLKSQLSARKASSVVAAKRLHFNRQKPALQFNEITTEGLNKNQQQYVLKQMRFDKSGTPLSTMRNNYFRLYDDSHLRYLYPSATYHDSDSAYHINLSTETEKRFLVKFGGIFSSKPINTGYLGLRYKILDKAAYTFDANSYFGKYYGSLKLSARVQTAWKLPVYFEPFLVLTGWDYFSSRATFFEDSRPSYIVKSEGFVGLDLGIPANYKGKFVVDFKHFTQLGEYYLTEDFAPGDTADVTEYDGNTIGLMYERNTLNRKQYANKGTFFKFQTRYFNGWEYTKPGSTGLLQDTNAQKQEWFQIRLEYNNYFKKVGKLCFGVHIEAMYNTRYFFSNIRASQLFSPAYQPIPESKTLFLENYRANKFIGVGLSATYSFSRSFDFRNELHIFQPVNTLEPTSTQQTTFGLAFGETYPMGSSSLIFHSPIGPLSASLNYYDRRANASSFSFLVKFGYVIFNRQLNE